MTSIRISGNYIRLSIMMFLEFFVMGSTGPVISLYLKDQLCFTGSQTGYIIAASAVSSLFSPIIGALVADRIIRSERLLALVHILGAATIYLLSTQTEFYPIFFLYLIYWLLIGPSVALTTAITFHHLGQSSNFGTIRLWGTIGWIAAGGAFSYIVSSLVADNSGSNLQWSLYLASASSMVLGVYSLTLPHKTVKKESGNIVFRDSLKIILEPRLLFLALFCIIITFADRYYVFGGAIFLKALNFAESKIMLVLGIGQIPEIIGLFFLGFFISRFGMKKILLLGILFEIARFTIFMSKTTGIALITGISIHGLTYAFFFIPVTIFLDDCTDNDTRASVHQLFSIITGGIGNFVGNLLAGFTADIFTNPASSQITFTHYWFIPLVLSVIGLLGISICFNDKKQVAKTEAEISIQV